jgi:hypothetical protein
MFSHFSQMKARELLTGTRNGKKKPFLKGKGVN